MYNIVVCDDEKDIAAALEIYLAAEGYRVLKAENGREALSLAAKEEVHLMLLDIMMPQMDGLETLAKLREFSNIPVIFLTAKGEDTDKILGLNIGAVTTATEWKNIRATTAQKLRAVFTFPLFMFTYIPVSFAALFMKVEWKPIHHTVTARELTHI